MDGAARAMGLQPRRSNPRSPGASQQHFSFNAWLFVTLCVRCGASVWRELQPRGAGGGQAMVMGARGTLGGNPSSHHCSGLGGWLGPRGDRNAL